VICCNNMRAAAHSQWVQICVRNLLHEAAIKMNVRHHSVCLPVGYLELNICKVQFCLLLCAGENAGFSTRVKDRLRVFKKGVLERIYGTRVWK
jgi:hypothetical protein